MLLNTKEESAKSKRKFLAAGQDPGERGRSEQPPPFPQYSNISANDIHLQQKRREEDDLRIMELLEIIDRQEQIVINIFSAKKNEVSINEAKRQYGRQIEKIRERVGQVKNSLDQENQTNLHNSIEMMETLKLDHAFKEPKLEQEKYQSVGKIDRIFREKRPQDYRDDSESSVQGILLSVCKCHFPREMLKYYIIQKSKGRIVFPRNDRKFKLIKCPKSSCKAYIGFQDIQKIFEEEELKEVEEYNEQYNRKSYADMLEPQCVLCSTNKLSKFGCPRHPMCTDCEEFNQCKKCPALGCDWVRKD